MLKLHNPELTRMKLRRLRTAKLRLLDSYELQVSCLRPEESYFKVSSLLIKCIFEVITYSVLHFCYFLFLKCAEPFPIPPKALHLVILLIRTPDVKGNVHFSAELPLNLPRNYIDRLNDGSPRNSKPTKEL